MRNANPLVVILLILGYLAAGLGLGALFGSLFGQTGFNNVFYYIIIPFIFIFFIDLTNLILFPVANITMNRNLEKEEFGEVTTYVCKNSWSLRKIICIENSTGRVAYVTVLDPFNFQTADARDLSKISSRYMPGPFGGTRYVFFEFYYKDKRFRFPTFTSRRMWMTTSSTVQNAIAAGDRIRDLLLKFQPGGAEVKPEEDRHFDKNGIRGFIFACVSIYMWVFALAARPFVLAGYGAVSYILLAAGLAFDLAGIILGAKCLKAARIKSIRGLGFAKGAVVMGSIMTAIQVLMVFLFIFVR